LILAGVVLVAMLLPAWWLAGRLEEKATPFFRLLLAAGLTCVGYLSFVNLAGRLLRQSTIPAGLYIAGCAIGAVWLWRRRRSEVTVAPLWLARREWAGLVLLALVLGLPQMVLAFSTPYWDEVASSAIHLTAANQFAEGLFPPRHNALPDVVTKYHYAFAILSGSVRWLTGLSANVSVDVVSTALWIFTFLFVVHWLLSLGFTRAPAIWSATAVLLGGGLAWAFVRRVEAYNEFEVFPTAGALVHRYNDAMSVAGNLIADVRVPSAHLRNPDGTLSNLPWDIAAQFQQHAVSLGIALSVFALWAFVAWQQRAERRTPLLIVTVLTFGVLFLAHAVFGAVAAVTGGIVLLGSWLRAPTRRATFTDGVLFGAAIALIAVLHGGFLAFGAQYGGSTDVLTLRHRFGYSRGGVTGFLLWNLAGFGLPLLLAIAAWIGRPVGARKRGASAADLAFVALTLFAALSYFVPQLAFYSSETIGVEQYTEVSKFFFTARLGFALLSAWGVAQLPRRVRGFVLVPAAVAMAVTPVMFAWVHSTSDGASTWARRWRGFYFAPYGKGSVEQQMGERLRTLKRSNHDTYFDASADERAHGYLSEMLLFGGSVFTLTPSRYERTGVGYRLSQDVISARLVKNGRMAQLRPGAAEACECRWYYTRPTNDMAFLPPFVRARFDELVADGAFVPKFAGAARVLYSIEGPTTDVDRDIQRYWRPRVVMQTSTDWDGDGRGDLIFYDYADNRVLIGERALDAPAWLRGELAQLWVGRFPGSEHAALLFGRAKDTDFRLGRRIEDLVEQNNWGWSFRQASGDWSAEYDRWAWNGDIPLVTRVRRGGFVSHVMYRPASGEWFEAVYSKLPGPSLPAQDLPVPFGGRFLRGSDADLGVRSRVNGAFAIQSLSSGQRLDFTWGLGPNEVLVPGDYDGDGYDEVGIWNETNLFWYWRSAPDGAITQFQFGVPGAVPVPFDYNHDGRLDPAYWVPSEAKIYVTFTRGKTVDRVIVVPPHSVPAFVNVF
jgi:hypothetical protein